MIYLKNFKLASMEAEICAMKDFRASMTCYSSFYPFNLFPVKCFNSIDFEPLTILYGGNGSGKTSVLNIIAQTLGLLRTTPYNRTDFFDDYVNFCSYELGDESDLYGVKAPIPVESRIITSEDVFQNILTARKLNDTLDRKREQILHHHSIENAPENRIKRVDFSSSSSYMAFSKNMEARRSSKSQYVRSQIGKSTITQSNGETAYNYFVGALEPETLYLIDEPENSLSPKWQMALAEHIEVMSRYEKCQFIIATHSPFFMSIKPSIIYNLDTTPVVTEEWHQLENIRIYHDFFLSHREEFEK